MYINCHSYYSLRYGTIKPEQLLVIGMNNGTKTLALTASDIFTNPEVCTTAKEELLRRRGDDFKYEPLLGDREPPLDYRKN